MKDNNALIIIAKLPQRDSVMTRLIGSMSDEKRIELYIYLLEHTIQKLKEIPEVDTFISYSPPGADSYFSRFGLNLLPLSKGDLGKRMFNAMSKVLTEGYQKAVLVGVDIPELSSSIILKAFELLSDNDVVYGPAKDGGYYLVGIKTLVKEIFQDVQWSTDQTLKQSLERAKICGCRVAMTETLYDIDTIEDVKRAGFLF